VRRGAPLVALCATALLAGASGAVPRARHLAPPARQDAAPRDSVHPFAPGERFEYDVKFGIFRVGRASMEVLQLDTVRGETVYHVVFVIRGRAIFYSMNDSLSSWFSVRDLTSRRFIQDNEENGRPRYRRYEIHPAQGFFVRNDQDTSATVSEPLDDASFFYFARTLPLEVGRSYDFPRYFIPDRNPVTLRVLSRDTIDTPAGRFATIAVRPIFKSRGLFSQGGQATIWFSDDAVRIPVRIRSRLSVGTLDMSLRTRR
jgi:hypothetical protein